jgi:hypothetical protein
LARAARSTDAWNYDIYAQTGITQLAETYQHDLSLSHLNKALDAVVNPVTGNAVCRSVLNGTDPNCVPYNIFQQGKVAPEALNYIQIPLLLRGEVDQYIVSGNVTGDLSKYGVSCRPRPTARRLTSASNGVS